MTWKERKMRRLEQVAREEEKRDNRVWMRLKLMNGGDGTRWRMC